MRLALFVLAAHLACAAELSERLQDLVNALPAGGFAGIHVVELASGKSLFEYNAERLFLPASNLKLVTSAFALERLGVNHTFETRVMLEASGDLVLVGSGDPSLSGRQFPYQKNSRMGPPLAAIEELADHIVASGITSINGDIIGDDRLYVWEPIPPSWTFDDTVNDFGAPVSALSLNENVMELTYVPGAELGEPAVLSLSPALEYFTLDNRSVTVARRTSAKIRLERVSGSRQWRITGAIAMGLRRAAELLPVDDPALFAATALRDALTLRGIQVHGQPRARHRASGETYTPVEGQELASRKSPPLTDLLQMMDKVSHNLYAELMLREAARNNLPDTGSSEAVKQLANYLAGVGVRAGEFKLDDGSGLSRNDLVTPHLLTQVLSRMAGPPFRDAWMPLLPVGGDDGTLEHRFCCMANARGIRAKTGMLDRSQTLSGYAESKTYGTLVFSVMLNNFSVPEATARGWVDKIAEALLE